jgi:hypothetical protein
MKTRLIPALLAAALASPALAENLQFTLTNNSDYTIDEFYVSSPDANDWGDDVLGQDTLAGGQVANITITGGGDACDYDVKAVDEAGEEHVAESLDVCQTPNVTFDK